MNCYYLNCHSSEVIKVKGYCLCVKKIIDYF